MNRIQYAMLSTTRTARMYGMDIFLSESRETGLPLTKPLPFLIIMWLLLLMFLAVFIYLILFLIMVRYMGTHSVCQLFIVCFQNQNEMEAVVCVDCSMNLFIRLFYKTNSIFFLFLYLFPICLLYLSLCECLEIHVNIFIPQNCDKVKKKNVKNRNMDLFCCCLAKKDHHQSRMVYVFIYFSQ